jgi:hypothetical protein
MRRYYEESSGYGKAVPNLDKERWLIVWKAIEKDLANWQKI